MSYREHRCILVLRAYFDESGHSDDPITRSVSIGGAISSLEQWEKFEEEWKGILEKYGISVFHMKDFAHSRGEFEGWSEHEEKRRSFLSELIQTMTTHTDGFIWATTIIEDFKRLSPEKQVLLHDPYFPCFLNCIDRAARIAGKLGEPEKVEIVFARHPEFSPKALWFYKLCLDYPESPKFLKKYLGPISFDTPESVAQLQAVDLVAYEGNKIVNKYLLTRVEPAKERWPFTHMKEHFISVTIYNYNILVNEFGL